MVIKNCSSTTATNLLLHIQPSYSRWNPHSKTKHAPVPELTCNLISVRMHPLSAADRLKRVIIIIISVLYAGFTFGIVAVRKLHFQFMKRRKIKATGLPLLTSVSVWGRCRGVDGCRFFIAKYLPAANLARFNCACKTRGRGNVLNKKTVLRKQVQQFCYTSSYPFFITAFW